MTRARHPLHLRTAPSAPEPPRTAPNFTHSAYLAYLAQPPHLGV